MTLLRLQEGAMEETSAKADLIKSILKAIRESKVSNPEKIIQKALATKLDLEEFKAKYIINSK